MPTLLVILLIWYFTIGQNKPNIFRRLEGKIGKIFGAMVVLSLLSFFIPGMLGLTISLFVLLCTFLPVIIPIFIIKTLFFPNKHKVKGKKAVKARVVQEEEHLRTALTRSVPKRRKIIQKFNKAYSLGLEDEEINRIVDASYTSFAWEKEIYDMSKDYDSVYEWYGGITNWLRVYLKVLPIEHVSSDFNRQRQICLDTYKQMFDEIRPSSFKSLDDCISYINNRFFATFDENTFMIVYRFLEAHDIRYELPAMDLVKNVSELDRLREKYDKETRQEDNESPLEALKRKYDADATVTESKRRMY